MRPQLIFRNWRLKVLALLVACGMWVGVVYASNPPAIGTYYVTPQAIGLNPKLLVLYPLRSVPIKVAGVESNVRSPQVRDHLSAFVNLSGIKVPGVYKVHLTTDLADPNVRPWSAPTTVTVTIDRWETASLTVRVVVPTKDLPVSGYEFNAKATTATPATVSVRAPATIMSSLQAETIVDLAAWKATVDLTEPVTITAPKGVPSGDITFTPLQVTVHASITSITNQVTLPVDFILSGQVASGYQVTSAQVTPATVTATGPPGTVDSLGAIDTQPIDISGISKDTTYQVDLNVPSGVTTSVSTVTIVVSVSALPASTSSPSPSPSPSP